MMHIRSQHAAQSAQVAAHHGSAQSSPTHPGKFNAFHQGKRITHAVRKPPTASAAKSPLKPLSPRPQPDAAGLLHRSKATRGAKAAGPAQAHAYQSRPAQPRNVHGKSALPHEDYVRREQEREHERQEKDPQQRQHRQGEQERQRDGRDSQDRDGEDDQADEGVARAATPRGMRRSRDVAATGGVQSFVASSGNDLREAVTALRARCARMLLDTLHRPVSEQRSVTAELIALALDLQNTFRNGATMLDDERPLAGIRTALIDADASPGAATCRPAVPSEILQRLHLITPLFLLNAARPATQAARARSLARLASLRNHMKATHARAFNEASQNSREVRVPTARAPGAL
jgi:hypothetical protein